MKLFHNDTDNPVSFGCYAELGIHVFNFTHLQPLDKVRELVGPEMCLMGNVPPLEVLAQGHAGGGPAERGGMPSGTPVHQGLAAVGRRRHLAGHTG